MKARAKGIPLLTVLCGTMALWPLADSFAATRSAVSVGIPPAPVQVDDSEVGIMSAASVSEISRRATEAALQHGIKPDQLRVTLVVLDHLEAIRGVRVAIETPSATLSSDDQDPRGPLVAQCSGCAEAELARVSVEGVLEGLRRFESQRAPAPPETRTAPMPSSDPPAATMPPPDPSTVRGSGRDDISGPHSRSPLGRVGWAGVGLGLVGVATGVAFVGLDRLSPRQPVAQDRWHNYRLPGLVVLGASGALAIAGSVIVGLDRRTHRRARLSLTPSISTVAATLLASGRF